MAAVEGGGKVVARVVGKLRWEPTCSSVPEKRFACGRGVHSTQPGSLAH